MKKIKVLFEKIKSNKKISSGLLLLSTSLIGALLFSTIVSLLFVIFSDKAFLNVFVIMLEFCMLLGSACGVIGGLLILILHINSDYAWQVGAIIFYGTVIPFVFARHWCHSNSAEQLTFVLLLLISCLISYIYYNHKNVEFENRDPSHISRVYPILINIYPVDARNYIKFCNEIKDTYPYTDEEKLEMFMVLINVNTEFHSFGKDAAKEYYEWWAKEKIKDSSTKRTDSKSNDLKFLTIFPIPFLTEFLIDDDYIYTKEESTELLKELVEYSKTFITK